MKLVILVLGLLGSLVLGVAWGSASLPVTEVVQQLGAMVQQGAVVTPEQNILYAIRIPRVLFAACCGAILSLVGLLMQTVSHNALADPYILGVSSGASTGAVAVIVWGLFSAVSPYGVYIGAFVGALAATICILVLQGRSLQPMRLILMGIGISAAFSALTLFIIYGAPHESLVRSAMFWVLGSFAGIQWSAVPLAVGMLVVLATYLYVQRHTLDILLLGQRQAQVLGVRVGRVYRTIVVVSSLAIAVVVSLSGIIGFVGLIVPHMARQLTSPRHGSMLVYTMLIGAILMVAADIVARALYRPQELPIGVVTSLLGAPVFLYFIYKQYGAEL